MILYLPVNHYVGTPLGTLQHAHCTLTGGGGHTQTTHTPRQ